jgi:hypothetical protein
MDHVNIVKVLGYGERGLLQSDGCGFSKHAFMVLKYEPESVELF